MKKLYPLLFLLIACKGLFAQNYTVLGDAAVLPGCNCYQLTANQGGESGAVYQNTTINLNNSFDFTFSNFFGCNTSSGADGEVFVLTTNPGGLGTGGGGLGYGGNTQPCSLGIEFDTYQNSGNGDPWYNHTGYESGGLVTHNVVAPVSATVTQGYTLDNCQWHTIEIVWDANTQVMTDIVDGSTRISQALPNLVSTYLCGNPVVSWGWTAGTGAAYNLQQVCMQTISSWVAGTNYQSCSNTVQFNDIATSNTGDVAGWAWTFGDGGSSPLENPSHTYADTGTYLATLVITNVSGCTDTFGHLVHIAAPITLTPTITEPLCNGELNGSIAVSETGGLGTAAGNGGFTYTWNNGTLGNTDTALGTGNYSVSVTDGVCTASGAYTVNQPAVLAATATQTNVACFGQNTGAVNYTPTGGTPAYTYTWSNTVSNTGVASNLSAGAYAVTVTDLNGCSVDSSFSISQSAQAMALTQSQTNLICYDVNNGVANVAATGGTSPYSYVWTPGTSTINSATDLAAGNYTVLVTDLNQCTASTSYTITQPPQLIATPTQVNVLCYGQTTGSITVAISGGTGADVTSWTPNVSTTNSAQDLPAGPYSITVSDANACTVQQTVTITQPAGPLTAQYTVVDVACFGNSTGSVTVAATGGTPGYAYNWAPGVSTGSTAGNLAQGAYAVIVTDLNGCTIDSSFNISQPAQALALDTSQTNLTCYQSNNGIASVAVTGGTSPYSYTWTGSASTFNSATGLAAGNFSVLVTDNSLCQSNVSFVITQPTQVTPVATAESAKCFGQPSGSVTVSTTGGAGTTYTYVWNPNVGTASSADSLAAADYTITATDASGCTASTTATVGQPQAFDLSATATPVSCYNSNNGTITVSATGGTPAYNFAASDGAGTYNSTTGQFDNLASGTYTIALTDQNGCTVATNAVVNHPMAISAVVSYSSPTCSYLNNGSINIAVSGGNPGYTFTGTNIESNTSGQFTNLAAGNYVISITDSKGCDTSATATLTTPDSLWVAATPAAAQVKLGDTAQITALPNQTVNISYSWSPDFGLSCYDCPNPVFNGVYSQPYTVQVTNDSGCIANTTIQVTVVPNYDFFVPNAFAPAAGGQNAYWQMYGNSAEIKLFEVAVFDRIGEKVFESSDVNFMWDGTFKGQPAPMGVYVYTMKIVWLNNYTNNTVTGSITLLR